MHPVLHMKLVFVQGKWYLTVWKGHFTNNPPTESEVETALNAMGVNLPTAHKRRVTSDCVQFEWGAGDL